MDDARRKFALAMGSLSSGTRRGDVLRVLGSPDCVFDSHWHPDALLPDGVREVLCYGVEGDRSFPSLGHVLIGEDGRVEHLDVPPPPVEGLRLPEDEVRAGVMLLDTLPGSIGNMFNPRDLIHVANAFIDLGQRATVLLISEFLRLVPQTGYYPPKEGLFLLARVLFEVPEGHVDVPTTSLGDSIPRCPSDRSSFPRFPLTVEQDIPFLLIDQFRLLGVRGSVADELQRLDQAFRMRDTPYVPTTRPESAFFAAMDTSRVQMLRDATPDHVDDADLESRLANQLLRMAPGIEEWVELLSRGGVPYIPDDKHQQGLREFKEALAIPLQWDRMDDAYVRAIRSAR